MIFAPSIDIESRGIKKPYKRYFDDKRRKREVTVTISGYYPVGMHYHVSIRVEENLVWDEKENTWCAYRNDPGLSWEWPRGISPTQSFGSYYMAERYAKKVFKLYFSPEKFTLDINHKRVRLVHEGD